MFYSKQIPGKEALKVMKSVRNIFFLLVLIAVLVLPACTPIPNAVDPQNALSQEGFQGTQNPTGMAVENDPVQSTPSTPGSQQVTPEVAPTSLPTNTPEPSPTPRPHYDINDPATWPQEMQDYFNRVPEEWNNPTRQYLSNEVFDQFIQQSRRDFLTDSGIDITNMTDQEVMLEYQRLSFEHGEIMVWSPQEIVQTLSSPFKLAYIDGTGRDAPKHGGTHLLSNYRSDPGNEHIEHIIAEHSYSTEIFGTVVQRPPNAGAIAINTGMVRIPGVDPQNETLVFLTYKEEEITYRMLVSIPLQKTTHFQGDAILDQRGNIIQVSNAFTLQPAINGLCSGGQDFCLNGREMPFLTLNDIKNSLGSVILINPHYASPPDTGGVQSLGDLNNQHIERGYAFESTQSVLVDMSLPWDTP